MLNHRGYIEGPLMQLHNLTKRFMRDQGGSIAIISGVAFICLCIASAIAIDSSRAINVNSKLQSALDAAALASAKILDDETMNDADVRAVALAYFNAHRAQITMNNLTIGTLATAIDRGSSTVRLSVSASLQSMFGSLAGMSSTIALNPESETTYKSKKIEISLVLDITGSMNSSGKIAGLKVAAKDLVDVLFATNPNRGGIRISLVPYSASVNAGSYKAAVTGGGGSDNCVVERLGVNQATDEAVASGGYLGTSTSALNSNYSCPVAPIEPLLDLADSAERNAFEDRIDGLSPSGGTAGHTGLAWGWYMLSDQWASLWPSARRPKPASPDIVKAIILMTDGEFNTSYGSTNINSVDPLAAESSPNQALALCEAIKTGSDGIKLYTVGFQAPVAAESMLRSCSGDANFFDASSTGDLIASFREIAERLTNLRVTS